MLRKTLICQILRTVRYLGLVIKHLLAFNDSEKLGHVHRVRRMLLSLIRRRNFAGTDKGTGGV